MTTEQVSEKAAKANGAVVGPQEGDHADDVHLVPLSKVKVKDKFNVRTDLGDIEALKIQIKDEGLLTPLTVDQDMNLLAGFRRHAALTVLYEKTPDALVKVTIKDCETDAERLLINLGENTGREAINDCDLAKRLVDLEDEAKYGIKRSKISRMTGLSQSAISKLITTYTGLSPALHKAWKESYAGELKDVKGKPIVLPTIRLKDWAKEEPRQQAKLLDAYLDNDRPLTSGEEDEDADGEGGGGESSGGGDVTRAPTKKEIKEKVAKLEAKKEKDGSLDEKDQGRLAFGKWVLGITKTS